MSAAKLNLTNIEKGSTYRYTLCWKDAQKEPINLIGCTAKMHIRASIDNPLIVYELNTSNGGVTIIGELGRIDLLIPSSVTKTMRAMSAIYDIEIIFSGGETYRLIEGTVVIKAGVTR